MRGKVRGTATKGSLATGGQTSSAPEWLLKRFQRSAKPAPSAMTPIWKTSQHGSLVTITARGSQGHCCECQSICAVFWTNAGSVREINTHELHLNTRGHAKNHMTQFHPRRHIERKPGLPLVVLLLLCPAWWTAWYNGTQWEWKSLVQAAPVASQGLHPILGVHTPTRPCFLLIREHVA